MIEVLIFRIDQFSFWAGFIAGILFAWLLAQASKFVPIVARALRNQIQSLRESLTTGTENRMRQDVLVWAQNQHLAASLFSMDEIAIQPRLLGKPIFLSDDDDSGSEVTATIPYMPDWPELAAAYGAATITLPIALQGGVNLLIVGQPGTGKTVALAHLASQIARREPAVGELASLFPLFLPAAALQDRTNAKEPIDGLIQTMSACYASPVTLPRLKSTLRYLLDAGRVLLLLDGLDELNPQNVNEIQQFLRGLLQRYPRLRLVAATSPGDFGGLNQLGLVPLGMAVWNEQDKQVFINQWQTVWNKFVVPDELTGADFIDSLLVCKWLGRREIGCSPLELTLKTWGAFAGDTLGPGAPNEIEAHIRRLTAGLSQAQPALEALAADMVKNLRPVMPQRDAENTIARSVKTLSSTPILPKPSEDDSPEVTKSSREKGSDTRATPASQLLSTLLNNRLLASYGHSQIGFAHSIFMGYLAGSAYSGNVDPTPLNSQPDWTGRFITLGFLGYFGNITGIVEKLLEEGRNTPIHSQSFQAARWLQLASKNAPWRPFVMRYLLNILQKDYETLGLSGRALTALTLAGDAGVNTLLRQLLRSNHANIRQLAALGLGMLGESKSVPDLASLLDDDSPGVVRAGCLGLIGIGNKAAIDAVITVLLNGSEEARRAASEALVNLPKEGLEILKEGMAMDDLLVRRAVIYGMVRAKDNELASLLEQTAIQDSQWVVKNAAAQALEGLRLPNPYIPKPAPPLTEQSWLINFAAKSGMGVGEPAQAFDMLLQALDRGEPAEKLKALEYLCLHNRLEAVPRLYHTYYGSKQDIREACYTVLWHTASAGIELPSPIQFGLGSF